MKRVFVFGVWLGCVVAIGLDVRARTDTAQCGSPAPGQGWVCQDGGWLPPGHPLIRPSGPVTPVASASANPFRPPITERGRQLNDGCVGMTAAAIADAAWAGRPLPPKCILFTPPLVLRGLAALRGEAGRTILVPLTTTPGPLVVVETPASWGARQVLQDILIQCQSTKQTGLVVNGYNLTIDRVTIYGCDEGINFGFTVNVVVRDSMLLSNRVGVFVMGSGPAGGVSVTTLRFSGTRFARNTEVAARIGHGVGVVFDNSTIIEGNSGTGILIAPTFPGAQISVLTRDVWYELNGRDVVDPLGVVRSEGITGRH